MNADPAQGVAMLRQLHEIAARIATPSLVGYCAILEGHALVDTGVFATARVHYERALEVARDTSEALGETQALRAVALAATGLGAPDALGRCRDALDALYELRYWQKLWQAMESTTLALASAGRTADAAVLIGHLDVHLIGAGLEANLGYRDRARALIDAAGSHAEARERGARMSADQIVIAAIGSCVAPQT